MPRLTITERLRYRMALSGLTSPYKVLTFRYLQRPAARFFICWLNSHDNAAPGMTTLMAMSSGKFKRCRYCGRFLPKKGVKF